MLYAIVNNIPEILSYWKNVDGTFVWTEEEVVSGTVINLIEYNGSDEYEPPANYSLMLIGDGAVIGDLASNFPPI